MKMISRAVVLLFLALALVGCSDDDDKQDNAEARTKACRLYLLTVGQTDIGLDEQIKAVATEVQTQETVDGLLDTVSKAAIASGLIADLSDADFKVFLNQSNAVSKAGGLFGDLNAPEDQEALGALRKASADVRKLCS